MLIVHDNFVTLPANVRELALEGQNGEELNNLFFCATTAQGDMLSNIHQVIKHPSCCQTSKKQGWIQKPCHN